MGLFVYLLLFFIVVDVIIFVKSLVKVIPAHMLLNVHFYARVAVIFFAIGIVSYGLYNGNQTKLVSYDVQLNKKNSSDEIKIVLISDLHLGDTNSEKRLESIIQGINSLNPDIVCIVGDIFNDDYYNIKNPAKASALFRNIGSTFGVYASLGNHDGGSTLNEMMDFLERSNVKLLKVLCCIIQLNRIFIN